MSDIEYHTFDLPNLSLIKAQLPTDIYNSIMSEVREIQNYGSPNTWNHNLAGAIEREYRLIKSRSSLDPFLIDLANEFKKVNKLETNDGFEFEYEMEEIWVNYQQKNEYNPIHNHTGDLSFVIWMEIPFKYSDERKVKNVVNSNSRSTAASFDFVYNDILGNITNMHFPVEQGWEGRLVMFPSKLFHQVYPFQTSDGYRISLSGNLRIINKTK